MKDNSRDWTWDTLDNSWGHEEKDRLFRPSELQLQGCSARILTTWRESNWYHCMAMQEGARDA